VNSLIFDHCPHKPGSHATQTDPTYRPVDTADPDGGAVALSGRYRLPVTLLVVLAVILLAAVMVLMHRRRQA
ncbi:MAG: hypothetical protein U5K27_04900, partial [Desulfotignum sp.]|nr:hypothetical protein [Desulfotignum sp.]